MKRTAKIALSILALAVYSSPAAIWYRLCRMDDRTKYILLEGRPIGDGAGRLKLLIQKETAALLEADATLSGNEAEKTVPLEALGFMPDVKTTIEEVDRIREYRSDPVHELHYVMQLRKGMMNVPAAIELDAGAAAEALLALKDHLDRKPVDAKVGWRDGLQIIDEEPGRILDVYGAINVLEDEIIRNKRFAVELPFVTVRPALIASDLKQLDTDVTISRFSTRFPRAGKKSSRRAWNIEIAASRIDGTVILSKGLVSFNRIVGPRNIFTGFKEAPEIFEGEMVPGVGGGVCQVSSTLHAAAYLGGLEIIERTNHSRPSSYITMGLDATVSWPVIDLKIGNPYPFPVMIKATVEKNEIIVEIAGSSKPVEVKWWRRTLTMEPFEDIIEYDESIPAGEIITDQEGIEGRKIKKTRKLIYDDGTEKVETSIDYYPPTACLLRMSPETEYVPVQDRPEGEIPDNPYDMD